MNKERVMSLGNELLLAIAAARANKMPDNEVAAAMGLALAKMSSDPETVALIADFARANISAWPSKK